MSTFEKIKRAALARLDAGEDLEYILQDYADFEDELRPVLEDATGASLADLLRKPADKAKVKRAPSAPDQAKTISPALLLALLIAVGLLSGIAGFVAFRVTSAEPPVTVLANDPCAALAVIPHAIEYSSSGTNQAGSAPEVIAYGGRAESDAEDMVLSAMPTTLAYPTATAGSEEAEASADAINAPSYVPQQVQQPLRAGEIDDNAGWDEYQRYRQDYLTSYGSLLVRDVDTTDRQIIQVVDREGKPLLGACVQIFNGQSMVAKSLTYATGMTMFFPDLSDATRYVDQFRVVVTAQDAQADAVLDRSSVTGVVRVQLDMVQNVAAKLDVLFLLDSTGSMGDEIAQLQNNILTIADQIHALQGDVDVRYGLVSYRDFGDQYVARMNDFTADVNSFRSSLSAVQADGGGDYPEAMNEALDVSLNAMNWRGGDTIRLVFLVADAPPHLGASSADYSLLMQQALARGIKFHPIASSGLQPEGEFIMRQIGQYTMGHFVFLTYEEGSSGAPGDTRTDLSVGDPEDQQGVGDYSVSQLDELVMRLIRDELNALNG